MTSEQQSRQQTRTSCKLRAVIRETPTADLIGHAGHTVKFQSKSIETMLHLAAASKCLVRRTFPRSLRLCDSLSSLGIVLLCFVLLSLLGRTFYASAIAFARPLSHRSAPVRLRKRR
jgi:hypothetical protein